MDVPCDSIESMIAHRIVIFALRTTFSNWEFFSRGDFLKPRFNCSVRHRLD